MSKLTELLNQIDQWVWQYNSIAAVMSPGLSLGEIHTKAGELSFQLPLEVIELYQWKNGGRNSFLPCPEGGYDLQDFLSLDFAISLAQEWNQSWYVNMNVFPLFYLEDILYYTVGSQEEQDLAPIYYRCNPGSEITPDYPSLTAMFEREIERLRTVWKID